MDPKRDAELAERARSDALIESYGDRSIAVLAFADLSPQGDNEYFSDGIAEEMINLLAKIPELRVISRSSAFSFKGSDLSLTEIAEQLNVSHILEGSVRKAGERIRVTAQLIDARSDTHLYSQNFDRTVDDIFAIQDEIAAVVVNELQIHLTGELPHARPTDPEAHALLLRARYLVRQHNRENFDNIESLLQQALDIDPDYLDALHQLINHYVAYAESGYRPMDDMRQVIRELIDRAFAIEPDNGHTIILNGYPDGAAIGNMPVAVDALQRGLAKDPTHLDSIGAAAQFLRVIGRLERSSELTQFVLSRDPLCTYCPYRLAQNHLSLFNLDEAEEYIRRFRQTNEGGTHTLATILFLKGDYEQAVALYQSLEAPAAPQVIVWHGQAMAGIALEQPELVREALAAMRAEYWDSDALAIAEIYAMSGDFDSAFEALEHLVSVNPREALTVHQSALLRALHDDPRWQAFLEKTGTTREALSRLWFDIEIPGERREMTATSETD